MTTPYMDVEDALVLALRDLLVLDDLRFPGSKIPGPDSVGIIAPDERDELLPIVILTSLGATVPDAVLGIGTGHVTLDVDVRAASQQVARDLSWRVYGYLSGAPLWLPPGVSIDRCDVTAAPARADSAVEGVFRWYATYALSVR